MTSLTPLAALNACLPHTMGCVAHRSAGPRGCICFHDDALARLLPVVEAIAVQRAADEIERVADERTWGTEHDNEVVSARDLYEQVARLRGELEPVAYDFPPDDAGGSL